MKEEMTRLEKQVLMIETKEGENISNIGLNIPKDSFEQKNFEYSSLNLEIKEEFKNAKWVVLTNPIV